ncbi:LapA family protein [Pseudidiomarina terrestris]|uniref:LapA family protein n=1 Tax=Pseudidiomarina terrestris TaxID=2820060 RepID=A0AAW7QYX5_9GAMM|nr:MULTISPECIES: LapA family protein [unclassified Pseudidiomarina]MDN7123766.1 LapA family protein [Pseudidiomarina sp. 1APP75-32.1]MDN7126420.1 LapA family protein [Pseudidiomarina sp. 1APR75-33.1]MDN7128510.1 LapA family protein [Pseudidiomarina sp. 1APR75-15]MDN7135242.1 LapA family protein [Pseudidiomarina sp. 1ASP75-5]MDN7137915.1 LapA family protein [Pseudidiomarina sp. 1ASP75-14]
MMIYIRQWQQKMKPQPGANPLMVLLSWLLLGIMLVVALGLGLIFLLVGWILLLPLLWRKRRQIKQMWQFNKAAQQAQREARQRHEQHRQQAADRNDSSVIDGEYKVKDDD